MSIDLIVRSFQLDPRNISAEVPGAVDEDADEAEQERRNEAYVAKYLTRDPRLRMSFPTRALGVLMPALDVAGATFPASAQEHSGHPADGYAAKPDPHGRVADYKFRSNDGWHVTREECRLLGERLSIALERGFTFDARGFTYDVRADAAERDDRDTYLWLAKVRDLFLAASQQHGLEVW